MLTTLKHPAPRHKDLYLTKELLSKDRSLPKNYLTQSQNQHTKAGESTNSK